MHPAETREEAPGADQIYAIGYRRLTSPRRIWPGWPIARLLLTQAWRKRITKFALLACLGVVAVHGFWLILQLILRHLNRGFGAFEQSVPIDPGLLIGQVQEVLGSFISVQFFATAIALSVIAAGAIAEDRRTHAFELYFSRPLSRLQYALGKGLGTLAVPLGAITLPAMLLYGVALLVAPPSLRAQLWGLGLPLLGASLLAACTLSTTVLGLSAFGLRARNVGIFYVILWMVLSSVAESTAAMGRLWGGYLSPERNLRTVVRAWLEVDNSSLVAQWGAQSSFNSSPTLSFLALLALNGVAVFALWSRLRAQRGQP